MIYRTPSYLENFKCSASRCTDNCCIGWEIDIDSDTAAFYKTVKGDFGKRLEENISHGETDSFILKGERCPFLNENNLCDIIINLGEDKLCQICTDHPRYFEWYGEVKEGGLGLCCEEAAKLILTAEEPTEFNVYEIPYEDGGETDGELFGCLYDAREKIFSIIYNENKSIKERVGAVLCFTEELQYRIDNGEYSLPEARESSDKNAVGDMYAVLKSLTALEPVNEEWESFLNNIIESYRDITEKQDIAFYQRNLLIYFITRYFLKGVFDGEILSKVKLAAVSTAVITYIAEKEFADKGSISLGDMVNISKIYSKQVEYSQENLDLLTDLFYEKDFYKSESIINLF